MILVVQNSKELDVQRKLFLESMSLAASIVKPRTSSHQAIAETLDELQVCAQLIERLRFTFTPNGKREFVPRDQVFPLFFVYCLLLLHKNK